MYRTKVSHFGHIEMSTFRYISFRVETKVAPCKSAALAYVAKIVHMKLCRCIASRVSNIELRRIEIISM